MSIIHRLFSPVDNASLAYFRIVFGAIMLWEVGRYFSYGWIDKYYIDPIFNFSYYGFDWVRPWAGDGMYFHFIAMGILATCIMIGFKYRISASLFFVAFTYVFLLDQSRYLNHFYLVSMVSFLMILIPAHRTFSIDSYFNKKLRSDTAPAWSLWLLRTQIGIVYFFGGIAKLNPDWLRAEPLRTWLLDSTSLPVIGSSVTQEWAVWTLNYSALLIDLLVVPFLLWHKSRWFALGFVTVFHLLNSQFFSIGIFPWFMIAATLLFLPPDWPRRIFKLKLWRSSAKKEGSYTRNHSLTKKQKVLVIFLAVFILYQIGMPIRHLFLPGDVHWTEEGHNFSWHMKLRDKTNYEIEFYAIDPNTGETWIIDPDKELTDRQEAKMSKRPDMIHQYALRLAEIFKDDGYEDIEIKVRSVVALNDREPQLLIDPEVDLASHERTLLHKPWIVPLNPRE